MMKVVDEICEVDIERLQSLSSIDSLEQDAIEFIVYNKNSLKEKLNHVVKTQEDIFPPSLYYVYKQQYEDEAYKILLDELSKTLNLDPEERLRISKDLIKQVAGDLLAPERE